MDERGFEVCEHLCEWWLCEKPCVCGHSCKNHGDGREKNRACFDCDCQGYKETKMVKVYLLTTGDGSDGNEWNVISVHSTFDLAKKAQDKYSEPILNIYGRPYVRESNIEEWEVDANG